MCSDSQKSLAQSVRKTCDHQLHKTIQGVAGFHGKLAHVIFLKSIFPRVHGFVLFVTALFCAADSQAANVTLAWDPSPDPVTGYKIFYGEQSVLTNPATEIDAGNVLQYTITNLDTRANLLLRP